MMTNRTTLILLTTAVLWVAAGGLSLAADDPDNPEAKSAEREVRRLPAAGIRRIEFRGPENLGGEARIRTAAGATEIKIEISKNVHNIPAGTRSARILNSITVETTSSADLLLVEVKTPRGAEWEGSQVGVRADLDLLVPPGLSVQGESSFYDFDISGPFGEVRVSGKYGKIRVEGVSEAAELRTEFGALSLAAARGRVEVTNQYGTISLRDIATAGTPLRVRAQYGAVDVSRVSGPAQITLDTAPLDINDWTLETGASRIDAGMSSIKVHLAAWGTPQLVLENQNARVEITAPENFSATVRLVVGEKGAGRIRTRGVPLKVTRMDRWILEGIAGDGGGLLEVNSGDYGEILLRSAQTRSSREGK